MSLCSSRVGGDLKVLGVEHVRGVGRREFITFGRLDILRGQKICGLLVHSSECGALSGFNGV